APRTDVFHFYFGLTLVPKSVQFPLLRLLRKKSVFHYLGSDIRGKSRAELAYGKRADAEIVGSFAALDWVPEAHVVPPGLDLRPSAWRSASRSSPTGARSSSSARRPGTASGCRSCRRRRRPSRTHCAPSSNDRRCAASSARPAAPTSSGCTTATAWPIACSRS